MAKKPNHRFKVDFQSEEFPIRKGIWYLVTPEGPVKTIGDLKQYLASFECLESNFQMDVYLNGYRLLDFTNLSIIKKDETIVIKASTDGRDNSSHTITSENIKSTEDSTFESTYLFSGPPPPLRQMGHKREPTVRPSKLQRSNLDDNPMNDFTRIGSVDNQSIRDSISLKVSIKQKSTDCGLPSNGLPLKKSKRLAKKSKRVSWSNQLEEFRYF